jgi:hypothetical protein
MGSLSAAEATSLIEADNTQELINILEKIPGAQEVREVIEKNCQRDQLTWEFSLSEKLVDRKEKPNIVDKNLRFHRKSSPKHLKKQRAQYTLVYLNLSYLLLPLGSFKLSGNYCRKNLLVKKIQHFQKSELLTSCGVLVAIMMICRVKAARQERVQL